MRNFTTEDFYMMNKFKTRKHSDNSERNKQTKSILPGKRKGARSENPFPAPRSLFPIILFSLFIACENPYGKIGGADITGTLSDPAAIESALSSWRGVWYSHYGKRRLDGYTIGRWKEIEAELGYKLELFPGFDPAEPVFHNPASPLPSDDDYYIFYDDTVYGQGEDGSGTGNGGWGFNYAGIVRAVNIFNGNPETGAVIIEYFEGAYPEWLSREVPDHSKPYFGIFYRVLNPDCIQLANAVDLAALFAGEHYHTETATLEEAINKNTAVNDGEFISWGVVIPQDREK
jgi:hypothetical protein